MSEILKSVTIQMTAREQLFLYAAQSVSLWVILKSVTIQTKTQAQYYPIKLFGSYYFTNKMKLMVLLTKLTPSLT